MEHPLRPHSASSLRGHHPMFIVTSFSVPESMQSTVWLGDESNSTDRRKVVPSWASEDQEWFAWIDEQVRRFGLKDADDIDVDQFLRVLGIKTVFTE